MLASICNELYKFIVVFMCEVASLNLSKKLYQSTSLMPQNWASKIAQEPVFKNLGSIRREFVQVYAQLCVSVTFSIKNLSLQTRRTKRYKPLEQVELCVSLFSLGICPLQSRGLKGTSLYSKFFSSKDRAVLCSLSLSLSLSLQYKHTFLLRIAFRYGQYIFLYYSESKISMEFQLKQKVRNFDTLHVNIIVISPQTQVSRSLLPLWIENINQ